MKETLEELQARWPLFKFEPKVNGYTGEPGFRVYLEAWKDQNGSSSLYVSETISDQTVDRLDFYHKRLQVRNQYLAKYPYLWFYIGQEKLRVESVWVRRDERDGEGFNVYGDELRDPVTLEFLDNEARKAQQEGWFICLSCGIAKPPEDYAYFYFAGKFCKDCKEQDPEHYRQAMNESYN